MNRSSSKICFQEFLHGDGGAPELSAQCNGMGDHVIEIDASQPLDEPPTADVDPGEYAVALKRKLDMYCAAVVQSRGSKDAPLVGLQSSANGYIATGGLSQLYTQNSGFGSKSATSCSSKELSEENEEDLEEGNDTNEDMDTANAKRMRRMLSNRESARRSRRRKQAHMNDIETEVLQLRVENASLLKRLTDLTQKYNEISVDNRVLKADVETFLAKVKMAEDKVKRVIGLEDELYRSISSDMSEVTMPFSLGPHDKFLDMAVPGKEAAHLFRKHSNEFICPSDIDPTGMVIDRTNTNCRSRPLKRVASLESLQKKMCVGSGLCDLDQSDTTMRDDSKAPDKQN